ncbi:PAS domain-containing sensor histidine kinase [Natrinema sp. 1APR25-10V2]|uniref:PAS domain-containing sensor histidine kinase n=1 Tax=Natrinema sp. 1APR25-10V2 TaxID=2951081 RepID=UPI0028748D5C|nr:PAS domain-containing sensor histidine kinase [Natrinema sp. 1APR25-10V2]MDS0474054.1 PAS domain-containing sensor histidine kinase [Natrinema sp. 1APR25-10V2]
MTDTSTTRLPRIFDDLQVGTILHEPKTGDILDVNTRLEELYGYSRSKLREMEVGDVTATSRRFSQEEALRRIQAAADGEEQVFEWQIERANGELVWIRVCLSRATINGPPCVLAEIRDITEYKARERRLRLLSRVVRHNLRNETNVLMGYAERLKSAIEDETLEEEVETISEIATEIGTLSDSIRQVEEIAEPDATERSPTDLGDLVKETAAEIRSQHPEAELTVDIRSNPSVNVDRGLRYAVKHALENATVHNDRETPIITVVVTETTDRGEIRVIDTGPAIPDVETTVLKEPVTASTTYHGSGIGLWVMQWCVDALGGELVFEENDPRGNVVRFLLPENTQ